LILKSELKKGFYYTGTCRNTRVAQWNGDNFIFINYQFTQPYIETIKYYGDVINVNIDGFIPIMEINVEYEDIKQARIEQDYRNSARQIYKNIEIKDLKDEEWKEIIGFKKYLVSNLGRIKKVDSFILKQNLSSDKYCFIALNNDKGVRKTLRVHRLVAMAFCEYKKGCEVNHINNVKTDNRVENLEWVTHKINSKKNFSSGNFHFKLKPEIVMEIKELLKSHTMKQKDIAVLYGVGPSVISDIKTGKKWN